MMDDEGRGLGKERTLSLSGGCWRGTANAKAFTWKHICLTSVTSLGAAFENGSATGLQTREMLKDTMVKTLTGLYFDQEKH